MGKMFRALLILLIALSTDYAVAVMPSHPENDSQFHILPNGQNILNLRVNSSKLQFQKGSGVSFSTSHKSAYEKLKKESQTQQDHKVQWALMDLDSGEMVSESLDSQRKVFGASTSKVFVAGALLDWNQGQFLRDQMQLAANMIVVSSNTAWTNLQQQLGGGSANLGRERNHDFTQKMGYERTRGFQGYLGDIHGNELTAKETVHFMRDTYQGRYPGSEYLWKLMYTSRTGANRGKKYLPKTLFVGGKTGTYDGTTVDPETGSGRNPDGSAYKVKIRNHLMVFNVKGRQYALAVLANSGQDESAALLAGGLYREYLEP